MAYKTIEKRREYAKKHYQKNKDDYKKRALASKHRILEFVRKLKQETPCTDCKISYPYYVMEFDHLRDKKREISKMYWYSGMEQLKLEIAKCEIVCANCHKVRTYDRIKTAM